MATDLERLVVSLDADITRLTKQLSKAGVLVEGFGKDADAKTRGIGKKISDNLAGANDNKGLNFVQLQELGHVARATFESIVAGANPLKVIAQEGIKASAAIGPGGLSGFVKSAGVTLAGFVSPAALVAGGLLAVGGAAVYSAVSFEETQQQIRAGLSGIGAASGATVDDIDAIGEHLADTQKISVAAGREIALAIAKTGKVGVGQIGSVGDLTRGFANLTGTDMAEAGKQLAGIFADPAKGSETLNALIGSLDDRTIQYIGTLARQGDRQKAISTLVTAVQPQLAKAAENTSLWARAWEHVASAASGAANAVGSAVAKAAAPTDEQQAAALKRRIDQLRAGQMSDSDIEAGAASAHMSPDDYREKVSGSQSAELDKLTAKYNALTGAVEAEKKAAASDADAKAAAALTAEAGAIVRAYDEAGVQIRNLEDDLTHLGKAIAASVADPKQQIEGGVGRAIESYDAMKARLDQLKSDYAEGGTAAAAALREANFARQTAGLSSYAKGLADINHQYDEQILKARQAGEARSIPGIETARQSAVAAYQTQSGERAKSQVALPDNFAQIVTGAEGNNAAKNPKSSASGIGQFIDSTFIALYRKEFSDLAATMDDAAVLKLKSDFAVNQKLIEAYGRENAVTLQNAGFQPTAQNLYLAHNYGPKGAINLLSAAPNASATDILGQKVADSNPAVANHTASQVIDEAARRSQRFSAAGRSQQDAIVAERASAEAVGKSAEETARLDSVQRQLNEDRAKGGELGQQFATAQDLIKASSTALTPALQAQRAEILALADARAKAAQAGLNTRFQTDLKEAYAALGRTDDQQAVYNQAKTYAAPGTDQFKGVSDELTRLHELTEAKSDGGDFVKSIVHDLIAGKSAAQAFSDELANIGEKFLDKGIDSLISGAFSAGTGSAGGGLFAGIGKLFGLADGGYVAGPGSSRSDSIPALLSNGEYVMNAEAVRKHGALIHALNTGRLARFADGGPVGMAAMPAALRPGPAGSAAPLTYAPHYTVGAAQGVTPQQLAAVLDQHTQMVRRQLPSWMVDANQRAPGRIFR